MCIRHSNQVGVRLRHRVDKRRHMPGSFDRAEAASAERDGRCDEKRTDDHHADAERGEPLDADAYAAADV